MSFLQKKGDGWYCTFRYKGRRHYFSVGQVEEIEARSVAAKVDYLMMRVKQGLLHIPAGMDVVAFVQCDGKPPDSYQPPAPQQVSSFAELRDAYLRTHGNGTIEQNTLDTCKLHLSHFVASLGEKFPIASLTHADLQRHIDRRTKQKNRDGNPISPVTIKKEVATLSGVWIWGSRMDMVKGPFPGKGLRYPKTKEPLPFMSWQEIERAIAAGGEPSELWDCLYLGLAEMTDMLAYAKEYATQPFVYPMMCFAAHTGTRRSEIMRVQLSDIDWPGQAVLIREKKRLKGKLSTRRVPLTPFLKTVLEEWVKVHPGGQHLFCQAGVIHRSKKRSVTTGHLDEKKRPSSLKGRMATVRKRGGLPPESLSKKESYYHFKKTLEGSKWEVLKGLHVLRHSFISTCASRGIDQRMVDEWVGHSTEEQRKRYRHLWPSTQQEAIKRAFA